MRLREIGDFAHAADVAFCAVGDDGEGCEVEGGVSEGEAAPGFV